MVARELVRPRAGRDPRLALVDLEVELTMKWVAVEVITPFARMSTFQSSRPQTDVFVTSTRADSGSPSMIV